MTSSLDGIITVLQGFCPAPGAAAHRSYEAGAGSTSKEAGLPAQKAEALRSWATHARAARAK
jgi:hypothetical protein